ncbi:MAG: carboxymuconolactone decarboxylase family protein [Planctomycetota bacterium]
MQPQVEFLLARPGLDPDLRVIVCAQAAACCGDWPRFERVLAAARDRGCCRDSVAEGLLQGVLFYGFPRSITAFEALNSAWPSEHPPQGGTLPEADQPAAGRALFDAIYGKNAVAVADMLARGHGELRAFVLDVAYGRILTRPALPPRTREIVATAVLAAMQQTPQMVAHGRGALHFGATANELREALYTCLAPDVASVDACVAKITRAVRPER